LKRVFLDANVLFSAANKAESAQGLLIEFAAADLIRAVTSPYALDEARRNLARKYPSAMTRFIEQSAHVHLVAEPDADSLSWARQLVVEKDAPVLASAARAAVDWFVTGDRADFGHLFETEQRGMRVMTPTMAVRGLL
jgi:predicted nucleic acid-binding protein